MRRRERVLQSGASNRPRTSNRDGKDKKDPIASISDRVDLTKPTARRQSFTDRGNKDNTVVSARGGAGGSGGGGASSSRTLARTSSVGTGEHHQAFRQSRIRRSVLEFLGRKFSNARKAFRQLDHNHDGVLDKKELVTGLEKFGLILGEDDQQQLEHYLDGIGGMSLTSFNRFFPLQETTGDDVRFSGHLRAPEHFYSPPSTLNKADQAAVAPFLRALKFKCDEKSDNIAISFRLIDDDHDGVLSAEDLRRGLTKLLPSLTSTDVEYFATKLSPLQLTLSRFDQLLRKGSPEPEGKSLMQEPRVGGKGEGDHTSNGGGGRGERGGGEKKEEGGERREIGEEWTEKGKDFHHARAQYGSHFETRYKGLRHAFLAMDESRTGYVTKERLEKEVGKTIVPKKQRGEREEERGGGEGGEEEEVLAQLCDDGRMDFTQFSTAFRPPPTGTFDPFTCKDDMSDKKRKGKRGKKGGEERGRQGREGEVGESEGGDGGDGGVSASMGADSDIGYALPSSVVDAVRKRKEFIRKYAQHELEGRQDEGAKVYKQKWDGLFVTAKPTQFDLHSSVETTLDELKKKISSYRENFQPVFYFFDPDRRGVLKRKEVDRGIQLLLQRDLKPSVKETIFRYFDSDGDGFVTYRDLCESLMLDEGESMLTKDVSARRFMRNWTGHDPSDNKILEATRTATAGHRQAWAKMGEKAGESMNGGGEGVDGTGQSHSSTPPLPAEGEVGEGGGGENGEKRGNSPSLPPSLSDLSPTSNGPARVDTLEGLQILMSKAVQSAEKFRNMFRFFDKDGDGSITVEEFKSGIRRYHMQLSEAEMDALVGYIDKDGNGEIQYGELAKALTSESFGVNTFTKKRGYAGRGFGGGLLSGGGGGGRGSGDERTEEERRKAIEKNERIRKEAIRLIDEKPDAKRVLTGVRDKVRMGGPKTLARLFRAFDKDKDHGINFPEFKKAICSVAGLSTEDLNADIAARVLFTTGDKDANGEIDFQEFVNILGDAQQNESAFLARLKADRKANTEVGQARGGSGSGGGGGRRKGSVVLSTDAAPSKAGYTQISRPAFVQPPTRFSSRPPPHSTFGITQHQPGTASYISEEERWRRPMSAPHTGPSSLPSSSSTPSTTTRSSVLPPPASTAPRPASAYHEVGARGKGGVVVGIAEGKRQRIQRRETERHAAVQQVEDALAERQKGNLQSLVEQRADYLKRLSERPF